MNERAKFSLSDIRRRPSAFLEAVKRGPVGVTRRGGEIFVFHGGSEFAKPSERVEARRRRAAAEILRNMMRFTRKGGESASEVLAAVQYGRIGR